MDKRIRVVAIEPDPVNRARFVANVDMNGASVDIVSCAIGAEPGRGYLTMLGVNRGAVRLTDDETETAVQVEPLAGIVDRVGADRIDAMKVDIEGEDVAALAAFFSTARREVWPCLLIAEGGRSPEQDLIPLCVSRGYDVVRRTKLNTIFELQSDAREG